MKITMNEAEAKELIACYFFNKGLMGVVREDIAIEFAPSPPFQIPSFDLMGLLRVMRNFTQRSDKIPAIKAVQDYGLRNGCHIGLADAKTFVEQFTPWN